jgi:hypothetical protein
MKRQLETQLQEMMRNLSLTQYTPGELAQALAERLDYGVEMKIKNGAIYVAHRLYINGITTADQVDVALEVN